MSELIPAPDELLDEAERAALSIIDWVDDARALLDRGAPAKDLRAARLRADRHFGRLASAMSRFRNATER